MNRISIIFSASLVLITFFSCNKSSSVPYTQDGNWTVRSQLDGPARSEAVSFTIGDAAYVGTGWDGVNKRYADFWQYNADNDNWTQVAAMPDSAARSSAVGFSVSGKGYVGTGYDGFNYLKDFWSFDPASNTWTKLASTFPGVARYEAVAFGLGNYGYVGTGYDGSNAQKDFYRYDPAADEWTYSGFSGNKRYSAVTFIYNNKAYLVTGVNSGTYVNDFWVFDPSLATGNWTELRHITNYSTDNFDDGYTTIVRSNAAAFVLTGVKGGDRAYITTGENPGQLTTTWEYDLTPGVDLWKEKTPFEHTARTGAVGFNVKNRGYVGTGRSGATSTGQLDDFMEFHPDQSVDNNDN